MLAKVEQIEGKAPDGVECSQRRDAAKRVSQDDRPMALFAGLLLAMMLTNGFTAEVEERGLRAAESGLAVVVERADVRFRGFFVAKGGEASGTKIAVEGGDGPN